MRYCYLSFFDLKKNLIHHAETIWHNSRILIGEFIERREKYKNYLRPSHADYSALKKYCGFSDYRGSGRCSGRMTAGFVMAGAIAKQILKKYDIIIFAYTRVLFLISIDFSNSFVR